MMIDILDQKIAEYQRNRFSKTNDETLPKKIIVHPNDYDDFIKQVALRHNAEPFPGIKFRGVDIEASDFAKEGEPDILDE